MTDLSNWLQSMQSSYPDPKEWKKYDDINKKDAFRFARLWLFEGIPFAFKEAPAVYELAREKLAKKLNTHPKTISMTGSGRIGYSLSSNKFGNNYNYSSSDFDLFIISETWFLKLKDNAKLFISRYNDGSAKPSNEKEKKFWPQNIDILQKNIRKGFINQNHIPNYNTYIHARTCYEACYAFSSTVCDNLPSYFTNNKTSIRIYESWEKAESQIGGSLLSTLTANDLIK